MLSSVNPALLFLPHACAKIIAFGTLKVNLESDRDPRVWKSQIETQVSFWLKNEQEVDRMKGTNSEIDSH